MKNQSVSSVRDTKTPKIEHCKQTKQKVSAKIKTRIWLETRLLFFVLKQLIFAVIVLFYSLSISKPLAKACFFIIL